MNHIVDDLKARYILIDKTVTALENKIRLMPEGRISIKRTKSGIYYIYHNGKIEEYLGKSNSKLVEQLIQKNYLEKTLKAALSEKAALEKVIKLYPSIVVENIYDELPAERRKSVKPLVPGNDQFVKDWLETPYHHKPFKDNAPFFLTMRGERVRSKSEVIIADRLWSKGIPYKYECPLKIGKKTIHPDFSILRLSDRKTVYLEHCGRMDDTGYVKVMVSRVDLYSSAGIIQGDKLFFTFETSDIPLDIRLLDEIIEKHFR